MVLLFAHHLLAGFRTREISVDFSAESVVVRIERISAGHLLRHYAIVAVHRIVHGLWPGFVSARFRDFSAVPELICILRLAFRCHSTVTPFNSTMWFNASG